MSRLTHVLLVGNALTMSPFFSERLRASGCACLLAQCYRDAEALLKKHPVDVVLSEITLPEGSAHPLLARLEGTRATLFFRVNVHRGSWWLPAMEDGKIVWGAPALRQEEFRHKLESLLTRQAGDEIPVPPLSEAEPHRKPPQRADANVAPLRKVSA